MAYKRISPEPVIEGGTGLQTVTLNGVMYGNGTSAVGVTAAGTTGQVLTATTSSAPSWESPAASSISITGDSGGALTGSAFTFNALSQAGKTVSFSGSGSTVSLNTTDANENIFLGKTSGTNYSSGSNNTVVGYGAAGTGVFASQNNCLFGAYAGAAITSGGGSILIGYSAGSTMTNADDMIAIGYESLLNYTTSGTGRNLAIGSNSLRALLTGQYNLSLGYSAGSNYTAAESSNICIGSSVLGTASESNVLIIGNGTGTSAGNLNAAYICGINGINVGSVAKVLTMASDQIGTATITAGTNISVVAGANTITVNATGAASFAWAVTTVDASMVANNGYIANKAGLLTMTLPASSAIGDLLEITGINTALGWKIAQNANQIIHFGTSNTTTGTGGSLASINIRDSVRLVCVVSGASAEWNVISSVGNITVV